MTDTDLARLDDDGFNSKQLHRRAKKRFVKAAKAFCRRDGAVGYDAKMLLRSDMIEAYDELMRT